MKSTNGFIFVTELAAESVGTFVRIEIEIKSYHLIGFLALVLSSPFRLPPSESLSTVGSTTHGIHNQA